MSASNGIPVLYLPDINTASYCPRLAAITRCFNLLRDGRTSNAGGSANKYNKHACKLDNVRA